MVLACGIVAGYEGTDGGRVPWFVDIWRLSSDSAGAELVVVEAVLGRGSNVGIDVVRESRAADRELEDGGLGGACEAER